MNPLADALPRRVRKYLYAALVFAGVVLAAWQAAEGNVTTFVTSLVLSLTAALAGSNVPTEDGDL